MPLRTWPPRRTVTGQGLAREGRLVDDRLAALDHPVDRHDLAGTHEHVIADLHVLDGNLLNGGAATHESNARRSLDERGQFARGPPVGRFLERVPTGEHQRDHRSGQVLAEGEGSGHRHEGDGVDAYVPAQERPEDGQRQRDEQQRRRRRPDPVGRGVAVEGGEEESAEHREERGSRDHATVVRSKRRKPAASVSVVVLLRYAASSHLGKQRCADDE